MASRTTDTPDEEFDLTHFLWGDLPLVRDEPGAVSGVQPDERTVFVRSLTNEAEDRLVAETASIQETSPTWGAATANPQKPVAARSTESDADAAIESEDEFEAEEDIDLDALAALAELADAGFSEDDSTSAVLDDEPGEFVPDERPLTYGELTQRSRMEILPHLRSFAESKDYLTLGYLNAVDEVQNDGVIHRDEAETIIDAGLLREVLPQSLCTNAVEPTESPTRTSEPPHDLPIKGSTFQQPTSESLRPQSSLLDRLKRMARRTGHHVAN